jgi:hypothetical protein
VTCAGLRARVVATHAEIAAAKDASLGAER